VLTAFFVAPYGTGKVSPSFVITIEELDGKIPGLHEGVGVDDYHHR
jgi:hypothetical protein